MRRFLAVWRLGVGLVKTAVGFCRRSLYSPAGCSLATLKGFRGKPLERLSTRFNKHTALPCPVLVKPLTFSSLSPSAKSFDPACSIGARRTVVHLACGTGHLQFAFAFGEVFRPRLFHWREAHCRAPRLWNRPPSVRFRLRRSAHWAHALFRCPPGTRSLPVPTGHTLSSGAHRAHALFRCPLGTRSLPVPTGHTLSSGAQTPAGVSPLHPDQG